MRPRAVKVSPAHRASGRPGRRAWPAQDERSGNDRKASRDGAPASPTEYGSFTLCGLYAGILTLLLEARPGGRWRQRGHSGDSGALADARGEDVNRGLSLRHAGANVGKRDVLDSLALP
jgi:hypothetical protein